MAIKALKKSRSVDRDLVQAILYRQIAQNAAMDDAETGPSQTTLLSAGPQNESNLEEKQAALFSSDVLFSWKSQIPLWLRTRELSLGHRFYESIFPILISCFNGKTFAKNRFCGMDGSSSKSLRTSLIIQGVGVEGCRYGTSKCMHIKGRICLVLICCDRLSCQVIFWKIPESVKMQGFEYEAGFFSEDIPRPRYWNLEGNDFFGLWASPTVLTWMMPPGEWGMDSQALHCYETSHKGCCVFIFVTPRRDFFSVGAQIHQRGDSI